MWSWASDRDARCRAQGRTAAVSPQTLGISWGHTGGPCPDWFSQSRRHASPTRSAWLGGHVSCPSPWQHLPLRGARPDPRVKLPPNLGTEGPHSQSCARSLSLAGRHRAVAVFARSRMLSSPASCSSPWGGGQAHVQDSAPTAPEGQLPPAACPHQPPPPRTAVSSPGEKSMGLLRVCRAGRSLLASGCWPLGLGPTGPPAAASAWCSGRTGARTGGNRRNVGARGLAHREAARPAEVRLSLMQPGHARRAAVLDGTCPLSKE